VSNGYTLKLDFPSLNSSLEFKVDVKSDFGKSSKEWDDMHPELQEKFLQQMAGTVLSQQVMVSWISDEELDEEFEEYLDEESNKWR